MSVATSESDARLRGRYNIQAVARRAGVPSPTIRAWERRYGLPRPVRSAGRQRLYSDEDVRFITWMRERTAEGMAAARAAALWQEPDGPAAAPAPLDGAQPPEMLAEEFVAAVLRHDVAAAEEVLGRAFALYDVELVCAQVVKPALVAIGEGWHRGEIEVATEHLGSEVARATLSALLRLVGSQYGDQLVLVAAAPGERHDLGSLMLAIALARRGLRVQFLGADVPGESLARTAERLGADAVALSAGSCATAEALAQVAKRLRHLSHPPLVAFGGQAYERQPELAEQVAGVLLDPDPGLAATRVRALLRNRHDSGAALD